MELFGQAISVGSGIFLLLALGMALSFEFVNGFHDTANAVATVIYTHALKPWVAVIWSGCWNLIGVLTSSGAVAFGVLALLPGGAGAERRLRRGIRHGFRSADFRHHLEPRNLVSRAAGFEFAHVDRRHHGSWTGQLLDFRQLTNSAKASTGPRLRRWARLCWFRPSSASVRRAASRVEQGAHQNQGSVYRPRQRTRPRLVDSRIAHSHLHRRELRARLERWTKRHGLIMLILVGIVPLTFAVDLGTQRRLRLPNWPPLPKPSPSRWTAMRRASPWADIRSRPTRFPPT